MINIPGTNLRDFIIQHRKNRVVKLNRLRIKILVGPPVPRTAVGFPFLKKLEKCDSHLQTELLNSGECDIEHFHSLHYPAFRHLRRVFPFFPFFQLS